MDTTYLYVSDDTKIGAELVDVATTEIILTTRFGQRVVLVVPSPRDGQRMAVTMSDVIYRAEKRGPVPLSEDPRKLVADWAAGADRDDHADAF